jgi:uncharacterized membrane protein affecting hemolysin expression
MRRHARLSHALLLHDRDAQAHRRARLSFHLTMMLMLALVVVLMFVASWWIGGHHQIPLR